MWLFLPHLSVLRDLAVHCSLLPPSLSVLHILIYIYTSIPWQGLSLNIIRVCVCTSIYLQGLSLNPKLSTLTSQLALRIPFLCLWVLGLQGPAFMWVLRIWTPSLWTASTLSTKLSPQPMCLPFLMTSPPPPWFKCFTFIFLSHSKYDPKSWIHSRGQDCWKFGMQLNRTGDVPLRRHYLNLDFFS